MPRVQHMVLVKFKECAPAEARPRLMQWLTRIKDLLPGMLHLGGGPYSSPEGLNLGYNFGVLITFTDAKTRDQYLFHPEHEKLKSEFLPLLDGVVAFDFEEPG